MPNRKAYLILGALHIAAVFGATLLVGAYEWGRGERADMGLFLFGAFLVFVHLLVALMQVDRVLRGKAGTAKGVSGSVVRYWRIRMVAMGAVTAVLQGLAVPAGIERLAPAAVITVAAFNVAMLVSGTLFGLSRLGLPARANADGSSIP